MAGAGGGSACAGVGLAAGARPERGAVGWGWEEVSLLLL